MVRLLDPVLDDLAGLVDVPAAGDLAEPTPCERFDVAGLRDHVLGWLPFFAAALSDPDARGPRPDPEAYRAAEAGRPLADDVRAAAAAIVAATHGGISGRHVVLSASRMDGDAALAMVLGEYVLHGWDLARALGRPWTPPPAACEAALQFFEGDDRAGVPRGRGRLLRAGGAGAARRGPARPPAGFRRARPGVVRPLTGRRFPSANRSHA